MATPAWSFYFVGFLLLLGVMVAAAVALRRRGATPWLALLLVPAALVLAAAAWLYRSGISEEAAIERAASMTKGYAADPRRTPETRAVPADRGPFAPWTEAGFIADVYPSQRLAFAAAANKAGARSPDVEDAASSVELEVTGDVDREILDLVLTGYLAASRGRPGSPSSGRVFDEAPSNRPRPPGAIRVVCTTGRGAEGRFVEVAARGAGETVTERVRFEDVPWAADPAAYARRVADATVVHVVGSRQLLPTAEEARLEALRGAVVLIEPSVESAVEVMVHDGRLPRAALSPAGASLSDELLDVLQNDPSVTNSFTQKVTRPYADLYHVSVLFRARTDQFRDLARRAGEQVAAAHEIARRRRTAETMGVALRVLAGLAGLLLVAMLYLVTNAATRGYYAWRLRTAALVLAAVAAYVAAQVAS